MKNRYLTLLLGLLFMLTSYCSQAQTYKRVKVFADREQMMSLSSRGLPVDDARSEIKGEWILEISDNDLSELDRAGIDYEVMIEDVSAYYVDRNKDISTDIRGLAGISDEWTVPEGFSLGSVGGFCSIEEMISHLDNMIETYPDLISPKYQMDTVSLEGRTIYWVRISDNPGTNEPDEPEILYTGMHHAREAIGMQQLLFYMYWLLENYSTDADAQYLIDNFELYFVPIINIDGYAYNIQTNPNGGGMWRKTRRDNGDGSYGVDANRNYGYYWGYDNSGSSPYPDDETYRGPSAFSEPCIIAIRDFCESNEFKVALNYHSYSNLLLYPWGYTDDPCPDDDIFNAHGTLMTAENGYAYGAGSTTIYPTNGGSDDWMYGEQEAKGLIYSYTPEVGNSNDGFWPSVNRIIPLCQENMLQDILAAKLAGAWATVEDISPSIIEETSGQFYFGVERLGLADDGIFTVSITPVNDAIAEVGDPMVFDNLAMLEYQGGSVTYELKDGIVSGEEIIYLLSIDNGLITHSDTITKVYGSPLVIFEDGAETFEKWSSPKWDITQSEYHSGSFSICDSPNGPYGNYENNSMVLIDPIDLSNTTYAVMSFWAKWDIEAGYDYVQVFVKGSDAGVWVPMSGKYTKTGNGNQAYGEPLYDGVQSDWVKEEIDLGDFAGQQILIRFVLRSDMYVTGDGFFWDDMNITVVDNLTATLEPPAENPYSFNAFPNPASDRLSISYTLPDGQDEYLLEVYNALGNFMVKVKLNGRDGLTRLNVSEWAPGIYYYRVMSGEKPIFSDKFVK